MLRLSIFKKLGFLFVIFFLFSIFEFIFLRSLLQSKRGSVEGAGYLRLLSNMIRQSMRSLILIQ